MTDKSEIGIFDPEGKNPNPLTGEPYSDEYKKLAKLWSALPAYEKAEEILDSIRMNQLTILKSATGSGKSLIVPKLALHYTDYKGKVVMTLPKRNITLSAASFSARTLDVPLGTHVGYKYKGSPNEVINETNKIVYMTDGSLVVRFVNDPLLQEYNVVILDEIHDSTIRMELLLLYLKRLLLSGERPDLRVVIMSATIDETKYQEYFEGVTMQVVKVEGKPHKEITVNFLDEPTQSYMKTGLDIIENLLNEGVKDDMLFFITTSAEAIQLCRVIRSKYPKVYCIELYSDMQKDLLVYAESRDKFRELGDYVQKLAMATNVAESSVTIDGLKYVIDSGYELYTYFNPDTIASIFEKRLISKASALQRRGRVGRTEPGICYHLLTMAQFNSLRDYSEPEILKEDITMTFLGMISITDSKTFDEGLTLLNGLMDVPTQPFIDMATKLYILYDLIDSNGRITNTGMKVTKFNALTLNRALFIIHAYDLHVAKEAANILAMMEVSKGKYSNLFFKKDPMCISDCATDASKELVKKMSSKKGDHLTYLNLFEAYKNAKDREEWARKYGVRLGQMKKAERDARQHYRKIIDISKAPLIERVTKTDIKKNLIEALKRSHKHLTASKMQTTYPKKQVEGKINKESALFYHYDRKALAKKKFAFDELVNISGGWEYSIVTLI